MLSKFLSDTSGAVTIDWVALTAGVLLVGMTVVFAIFNNGVSDLAQSLNDALESVESGIDTGATPSQSTFK